MESYGILWNPMESYGILWNPMETIGSDLWTVHKFQGIRYYLLRTTVRVPCFVIRQDVALSLHIQHIDIVVGQVDDPCPIACRIDDLRFCG